MYRTIDPKGKLLKGIKVVKIREKVARGAREGGFLKFLGYWEY